MLAREAGGAQPATQSLADLALVAVALGGVDVAITDTERGLDRVDADRVHQRHGAEPDRGNLCTVGFDEIHGMLPHSEAPARAGKSRGRRRGPERVTNSGGYWMPRLRRAWQPYFVGGTFSAPAHRAKIRTIQYYNTCVAAGEAFHITRAFIGRRT